MIRLQFATQNDPGSWLIRFYGHGAYSHVDTVMPDGSFLGARTDCNPGVQIRPPGYAKFSKTLLVELPCTDEVTKRYYDFVQAQVGKPYDLTAIYAFAAGRDWRAADSWFCSELVAAGMEESGFLAFPLCVPSNKITPPDLLLICSVLSSL
jgi:uncharacterized protein YycO